MNKILKIIVFLVLCIGIPCHCIAQESDGFQIKDGNVIITEVIPTEGKSKSAIYQDALLWVNETFNSPKTVIQTKEAELGLITLKSILVISRDYYGALSQWYDIKMTIQAKDGRFKYEISDIVYNFDLSDIGEFLKKPLDGNNDAVMKEAREKFAPLINSLKVKVSKPEEDW